MAVTMMHTFVDMNAPVAVLALTIVLLVMYRTALRTTMQMVWMMIHYPTGT